jgi:hypothetical protein
MKVEILYDGACPFCDDYVRYQRLRDAAGEAGAHRCAPPPRGPSTDTGSCRRISRMAWSWWSTGRSTAAPMRCTSYRSSPSPPGRWWVRLVARLSRTPQGAHWLYPFLKRGRRIALALLGISRF